VISGFHCKVDENCVLLGYGTAVITQKSAVLMCRVLNVLLEKKMRQHFKSME
jgi:hypothetical protein